MSKTAEFTYSALLLATKEQVDAVARMLNPETRTVKIVVQAGGFGLPDGYLAFRRDYEDGSQSIYGGISAEGDVST
jgi:hypothetical protein